jgi:patatin-related protein
MSDYASYCKPEFLRELRLGLVVYGGLSVAIYTNGISQEFYHAVRGRGIYKLMKALVDADVVVDTISGTSAGGVNGILLSYALANSNDRELINFSTFAKIWRNSGDIISLLDRQQLDNIPSMEERVDRDSYERQELVHLLERVTGNKLPRPHHEWFSTSRALDLFITATDRLGKVDRRLDESDGIVEIKSNHTLFHLQHRAGKQETFNPFCPDYYLPRSDRDTYLAIAKLCRITSNIPVLFPCVSVNLSTDNNPVDRQLLHWSNLQDRSVSLLSDRDFSKLYFCDGGLLDNQPFTYILKSLRYRPWEKIGERKIFYVDPTPNLAFVPVENREEKSHDLDRVIRVSLLSHPIKHSIYNDLKAIEIHNAIVIKL